MAKASDFGPKTAIPHAWGNITEDGNINNASGISSVENPSDGHYHLNLVSDISDVNNIVVLIMNTVGTSDFVAYDTVNSSISDVQLYIYYYDGTSRNRSFSAIIWDL